MPSMYDVLHDIFTELKVQIENVEPIGRRVKRWKIYEGEEPLENIGNRSRLYSITISKERECKRLEWGASIGSYYVPIDITVCYHSSFEQKIVSFRDFLAISNGIKNCDIEGLDNIHIMDSPEWVEPEQEDSKFSFMRIPLEITIACDRS